MSEIKFKRDTAFRKQFFVPDSFAHPAKMDAQLLIWIVEHYMEVGETILDPMAGSGTTMLACTLGRNVVLVELEEKFCKMMQDNWEQVKMRPQLGSTMGTCQIIQGDARQLEDLLCDKIISSPPYSDMSMGGGLNTKPPREGHNDQSGRSPRSPSQKGAGGYVDKIVTSPPYAETSYHIPNKEYWESPEVQAKMKAKYGSIPISGNLRNLPKDGVGDNPNNIGNLPYGQIDKIVTSPPYENQVHVGGEFWQAPNGDKMRRPHEYGLSNGQIGNLKSDSYLEAMLQVYQQCYKVLKSQGLMILVTKNFIRNKQVIRLDIDTIKLCEQAGFKFVERHYRKLPSQSFWRVIYHQKHPEVEQILNEDVLVFSKPCLGTLLQTQISRG